MKRDGSSPLSSRTPRERWLEPAMSQKSLPPIHPDDLRDQADPQPIERIWERLAPELQAVQPRAESSSGVGRRTWIAAAALAATFTGGLAIGRATLDARGDRPLSIKTTNEKADEIYAAGSE